jgi:fumarylpyruvate hydrolase
MTRRDLIYTGAPEGLGAKVAGDHLQGHIAGAGRISLNIGPTQA